MRGFRLFCHVSRLSLAFLFFCSGMMAFTGTYAFADSSVDRGKALSQLHCARCHVIPDFNPYGGIGSTPSFSAMKWLKDWRYRFEVFYRLPPHPSLVKIEGVTDPRDKSLPVFSREIVLQLEDVDDILAYADSISPPQ